MKKISEILPENFHFSVVKFSVHLNRLVFVMVMLIQERQLSDVHKYW